MKKTIIFKRFPLKKFPDGTDAYEDRSTGLIYYIDNRVNSNTKGEVFDKHPGEKDAKIVDAIIGIEG